MGKTWPTLYKKNSNGSIQCWTISVQEAGTYPAIVKVYGQRDGKFQRTEDVITSGKNTGKTNETTAYEQACLEAEAQWTKKKTGGKGYVEDIDMAEAGEKDILVTGGISPMLAHPFKKYGEKIVYPCYAQPKLDGIRCIAVVKDGICTLWTRTQKPILSMQHIILSVEEFCAQANVENITFDGELYNHDYRDKFEEIVSLVRPDYVKEGANVVQYHIYDTAGLGTFEDRYKILAGMFNELGLYPYDKETEKVELILVETELIEDQEDLLTYFEECRFAGYEGTIARNAAGAYTNKRSYDLQKIKEFEDNEYKIVDVEQGRGRMAGKAIFVCETEDGSRFNVKMEGSLSALEEIYKNKDNAVGKTLTVRYQGLTNGNIPRFPIGVSIRDYE